MTVAGPGPRITTTEASVTEESPQRLRRLLSTLFIGNAALFALYIGAGTQLLPTQVALIDPDPVRKALNLSVVTGSAAAVAALAQPVFGTLSDRSRRRNPWILWGSVASCTCLLFISSVRDVLLLAIIWAVVLAFANACQAAMTAVVPDRIPVERRGMASAVIGASTPIAAVVGVVIAAHFVTDLFTGYLVLGLILAAAGLFFVTTTKEQPLAAVVPATFGQQWRSIVSALSHRDFRSAFLSRAAMMFSYYLVFGYMLYLVEGRVQLPPGITAEKAITLLTAVAAVLMVIGSLLGGLLSDRLGRYRPLIYTAAVTMIVASLAPCLSRSFGAMIAYAGLTGLGFGCFLSVDVAIVTLVLPNPEHAARDMGVLNIANAAPQTAATLFAGLVVAAFGGGASAYGYLFIISMIFAALGGIAIWRVRAVP